MSKIVLHLAQGIPRLHRQLTAAIERKDWQEAETLAKDISECALKVQGICKLVVDNPR